MTCNHLNGDMDGDGDTDWDDYDLFVDWLTGHSGAGGTRLVYAWDAENRLIAAGPPVEGPPPAGAKRAEYAYDYMGRRIEKKVYTWTTMPPPGHWALTEHRRFVWAGTGTGGWLLLMELNGLNNNAVLRQYTWGLDLAGQSGAVASGAPAGRLGGADLEGAGGIGGLLAVHTVSGSTNYVYFYDANGNVGQVIDPGAANASASLKVKYEYDPYGTRTNSAQGGEFDQPFRFSTKYFDAETGLSYFGYRYYHPKLGRWMTRDPTGFRSDLNLYAFAGNLPSAETDPFGLCPFCTSESTREAAKAMGFAGPFGNCAGWDTRFYRYMRSTHVNRDIKGGLDDWPQEFYGIFLLNFLYDDTWVELPHSWTETIAGLAHDDVAQDLKILWGYGRKLFGGVPCDSSQSFVACGSLPGIVPLYHPKMRLSLQRFTLFWRAVCTIGPKECCSPETPNIGRADLHCSVMVMIYDRYDFAPDVESYLSYAPYYVYGMWGNPFEIIGFYVEEFDGKYDTCPEK